MTVAGYWYEDDPSRPLVGVDVDGVLNALDPTDPGPYRSHRVLGYRILARRDLTDVLQPLLDAADEGRCQLFWASMWEAAAPGALSPALGGLGAEWPYLEFTRPADTSSLEERREFQEQMRRLEGDGVYFKSPYVGDLAAASGRPVVWIDDECGEADEAYFRRRQDIATPVTCIRIDPRVGVTEKDIQRVLEAL